MAYGYLCTNCGHEQEHHDRNLVNEPLGGDFDWIEEIVEGYRMTILECMEKHWSRAYARRVKNLYWGFDQQEMGYRSPDPIEEQRLYDEQVDAPLYFPQSVVVVFNPRTGRSTVSRLE